MKFRKLAIVGVACLVFCGSLVAITSMEVDRLARPGAICDITIDGVMIENVPQALTERQMMQGLAGVEDVGPGMLFTWTDDARRVFWMRGTPTPLSIAFIDSQGVIVQIENMEPESEKLHWSNGPVREALEVGRGEFEKLGIGIGSRVQGKSCQPARN